ncbi:hypothetical protein LCE44_00205 [Vibrio harveyi]|uniref:hypothetical protein n=1 Tax=Vibrio harveyi TaxID=669 RepID=UPI003BF713CA
MIRLFFINPYGLLFTGLLVGGIWWYFKGRRIVDPDKLEQKQEDRKFNYQYNRACKESPRMKELHYKMARVEKEMQIHPKNSSAYKIFEREIDRISIEMNQILELRAEEELIATGYKPKVQIFPCRHRDAIKNLIDERNVQANKVKNDPWAYGGFLAEVEALTDLLKTIEKSHQVAIEKGITEQNSKKFNIEKTQLQLETIRWNTRFQHYKAKGVPIDNPVMRDYQLKGLTANAKAKILN